MELRRAVVTGLGAITPLGNNVAEYWEGLKNGVNGVNMITRFDTTLFKTKFACEVKNYDPTKYFDRKEAKKLDLYAQYALIAADQAVADAKLVEDKVDVERIGVIIGSGIGGIETFLEEVREYVKGDGTPRYSPFFIPKMISDIAAGHVSIKYGFRGPNYGVVSACATSTHAIIDALYQIRLGKADAIIVGGAEAAVTESGIGGFNASKALSTNNEEYLTASRPFDVTRDGFVMGEGAGIIVVEEYEHAIKRGAKIYCELVGGAMTADAYHLTAPHPEGLGAARVMELAMEDAGLPLTALDYVNVHGTATPLGDSAELKAVLKVFKDHAYNLNISSSKSMTGHLLGATGVIEALACIMSICEGVVSPTINFKNPDPTIDQKLNLTLNKAQKRDVKVALSNTFGFGGHNASVVFKKLEK